MRFVIDIGLIAVCVFGGYVWGYRTAALEVTPVHAYIQGQQDAVNDCREFNKVRVNGNDFACTGDPTQ